MLLTNIVLIIAVIVMIAIAVVLSRDSSGKAGPRSGSQQVRITNADADADDER